MTNRELFEFNKNRRVVQLCMATTRDIEEVLKDWVEILNVGPWIVFDMNNKTVPNMTYDGKPITEPFSYKCAGAMYGNIQIEIVQPLYGVTMADKFLERAGFGIQHVKEKISDEMTPQFIAQMEKKGIRRTTAGEIGIDKFCNFDMDSIFGFCLEIGNAAIFGEYPDPEGMPEEAHAYVYPRE